MTGQSGRADRPPGADFWFVAKRCSVYGCTQPVVGCLTLDRATGWALASERRCYCEAHADEVMYAVYISFKPKQGKRKLRRILVGDAAYRLRHSVDRHAQFAG